MFWYFITKTEIIGILKQKRRLY